MGLLVQDRHLLRCTGGCIFAPCGHPLCLQPPTHSTGGNWVDFLLIHRIMQHATWRVVQHARIWIINLHAPELHSVKHCLGGLTTLRSGRTPQYHQTLPSLSLNSNYTKMQPTVLRLTGKGVHSSEVQLSAIRAASSEAWVLAMVLAIPDGRMQASLCN
eukprot:4034998-Amphidinium_carterae.1